MLMNSPVSLKNCVTCFAKETIISEIVSNVDTKDRKAIYNQVGEY